MLTLLAMRIWCSVQVVLVWGVGNWLVSVGMPCSLCSLWCALMMTWSVLAVSFTGWLKCVKRALTDLLLVSCMMTMRLDRHADSISEVLSCVSSVGRSVAHLSLKLVGLGSTAVRCVRRGSSCCIRAGWD